MRSGSWADSRRKGCPKYKGILKNDFLCYIPISSHIQKLKAGINSVKGLGGTVPDPSDLEKIGDVLIPCGKPMDSDAKGLSLLYNEFLCIYSRKIMFFILIGTLYTMKVKFAFAMLYERSSIQRARIFSKF